MKGQRKVGMSGGDSLSQSPFDGLDSAGFSTEKLPASPSPATGRKQPPKPGKRGRVEIRREKSGRGGKTVTTATAFQGVCPAEQQEWVSELKKKCGAGGTSRPGAIEIQGDRREEMVRYFEDKGFRPILAGG